MLIVSIMVAVHMASEVTSWKDLCHPQISNLGCDSGLSSYLKSIFGTLGGFQGRGQLSTLAPDSLKSEILTFVVSNGAQLLYSLLYLLSIYNITLISYTRLLVLRPLLYATQPITPIHVPKITRAKIAETRIVK